MSPLIIQNSVNKKSILSKLKEATFDSSKNKIDYKTESGKISFWLNKAGVLFSVRFSFKINEKKISQGEEKLIKKYKRKIASLKFRRHPHSNMSEIIGADKTFSLSVFHPNSDALKPRIKELFLSESFLKR